MRPVTLQLSLCCAVAALASAACPSAEWKSFRGKCYYRSTFGIAGWSANDVCNFGFPGAKAVSIHDQDVNTFVAHDLMEGEGAWNGLFRNSDLGFQWLDGTPLDWTNWASPPTGTDVACGSINYGRDSGKWGSLNCDVDGFFICEIDEN